MFGPKVVVVGGFGPRSVHNTTTVTEKRAPTDESVRLLSEMEDAAKQRVEESIRLESNGFECVTHVERDAVTDDTIVTAHFKLNNAQMSAVYRHRESDDLRGVGDGIVKAVSERIAHEVLRPLSRQFAERSRFMRGAA